MKRESPQMSDGPAGRTNPTSKARKKRRAKVTPVLLDEIERERDELLEALHEVLDQFVPITVEGQGALVKACALIARIGGR